MRKFGLIGHPAEHSFSPAYFNRKFIAEKIDNAIYHYYDLIDLSDIDLLVELGIVGLNVTSPHKENVINYIDQLDITAQSINAVNTIKVHGGKKIGYNTDLFGFEKTILNEKNYIKSENCLVLGTGGASKAVVAVLLKLGYKVKVVSRTTGDLKYTDLTESIIRDSSLIVNATSLGMYPEIHLLPPFPTEYLDSNHFVYDLIYNPEKSVFLTEAEKYGAAIKNGYDMLVFQAEKSWEIWNQ